MLQADDYYTLFNNGDKDALRLSSFYLRKWGKFEQNASWLTETENKRAFILYSTLNEMTENERKFLAQKYRIVVEGNRPKADRELAMEYDMRLSNYTKIRRGVQYKFHYFLKKMLIKRDSTLFPEVKKSIQKDWLYNQLNNMVEYLAQQKQAQ